MNSEIYIDQINHIKKSYSYLSCTPSFSFRPQNTHLHIHIQTHTYIRSHVGKNLIWQKPCLCVSCKRVRVFASYQLCRQHKTHKHEHAHLSTHTYLSARFCKTCHLFANGNPCHDPTQTHPLPVALPSLDIKCLQRQSGTLGHKATLYMCVVFTCIWKHMETHQFVLFDLCGVTLSYRLIKSIYHSTYHRLSRCW